MGTALFPECLPSARPENIRYSNKAPLLKRFHTKTHLADGEMGLGVYVGHGKGSSGEQSAETMREEKTHTDEIHRRQRNRRTSVYEYRYRFRM